MTNRVKSFEPAGIEARWGPVWAAAVAFEPTLDATRPWLSILLRSLDAGYTLRILAAVRQARQRTD